MNEMIVIELDLLWKAFLVGVFLIAVYGLFLTARELKRHKKWLVVLEDFCFWLFAAVVLFFALYEENNGIVRGFFIAAAGMGMLAGYKFQQIFMIKPLKKLLKRITMKKQQIRERRKEIRNRHGRQKGKRSKLQKKKP